MIVRVILLSLILIIAGAPLSWAKEASSPVTSVRDISLGSTSGRSIFDLLLPSGCPEPSRREIRFLPYAYVRGVSKHGTAAHGMNVFQVGAELKPSTSYTLSFDKSYSCTEPGFVEHLSFRTPDLPPSLQLNNNTYLELESRQLVHLTGRNLDRVVLETVSIPPILIPTVDSKGVSWAADSQDGFTPFPETLRSFPELSLLGGKVVRSREMYDARGGLNEERAFSFPLSFRTDRHKGGLVALQAWGERENTSTHKPSRWLEITDIGLTVKKGGNEIEELLVWATSLKTGKPIAGLSIFASVNRSFVPLGQTGSDGLLRVFAQSQLTRFQIEGKIQKDAWPLRTKEIDLIIATNGQDATSIAMNDGGVQPDWLSEGGRRVPEPTKGKIMTERGIYRPGDEVHLKGVVTAFDGRKVTLGEGSVDFIVKNPKGEEVVTTTQTLNAFGSVNHSFHLKPFAPLGTYTVSLNKGGKTLASETLEVQEFQPPRHQTEVSFVKKAVDDHYLVGAEKTLETLEIGITGRYFAGGVVKNGRVRWQIYTKGTQFPLPEFAAYRFGTSDQSSKELLESGESVLDANGEIKVSIPLSQAMRNGIDAVEVRATVVDFDGKAASGSRTYQSRPEYLVGIGKMPGEVQAGDPVVLRTLLLDHAKNKIDAAQARVEVQRKRSYGVRKRNLNGDVYWSYEDNWVTQITTEMQIRDGEGTFDSRFSWGGEYLIRVTYEDGNGESYASATQVTVVGNSYGYLYDNRSRSYERLALATDRLSYAPGETIELFVNPHRKVASYLVTVERDRILQSFVVELPAGENRIEIPVAEAETPNIYIEVAGIAPRGVLPVSQSSYDDEAPELLLGMVEVKVTDPTPKVELKINADTEFLKVHPAEQMEIDLQVVDAKGEGLAAEIMLCVVDESILALTGYRTPELSALADYQHPLGVWLSDTRTRLMSQTPFSSILNLPQTGGDGDYADGEGPDDPRPDPVTTKVRKNFNPVAYYNAAVLTDDSGFAQVSFVLPDTMTKYRVFGVVVTRGGAFATAERSLLAVNDYYVEPGIPPFFTEGDEATFSVAAYNRTDQPVSAEVRALLSGEALAGGGVRQIASQDRDAIPFNLVAKEQGIHELVLEGDFAAAPDLPAAYRDRVELPLRINGRYQMHTETLVGTAAPGASSIRYLFPPEVLRVLDAGIPQGTKATLSLSTSPFLHLTPGLSYLLKYPYGCVEQTSSRTIPLAGLRNASKQGLIEIAPATIDQYLARGIDRLLTMQTSSGGFGYWPGDRYPHAWGSIYAISALTLAQKGGYPVDADRLNAALDYLETTLYKEENDRRRAFAHYLLALNQRFHKGSISEALDKLSDGAREEGILLVMAARLAGGVPDYSESRLKELLLKLQKDTTASRYGYFNARYRENSLMLLAMCLFEESLEVRQEVIGKLTRRMARGGRWSGTSDTGWILYALCEAYSSESYGTEKINLYVNQAGYPSRSLSVNPGAPTEIEIDPEAFIRQPRIAVDNLSSKQSVAYRLSLTLPRADLAKEGVWKGIKVNKTISNMNGNEVFRVGDIIKVDIDIQFEEYDEVRHYFALNDPLPAGFLAINSALKTEDQIAARQQSQRCEYGECDDDDYYGYYYRYWNPVGGYYDLAPNFFEYRDDRVLAFKNRIWGHAYRFTYYARAICQGRFVMPSTKAEFMYDPDIYGFTPERIIEVVGRE